MHFNTPFNSTFPINYARSNHFIPWHQEINRYQMLGYPPLAFGYTSFAQIPQPVLVHQQNNYYNNTTSIQDGNAAVVINPSRTFAKQPFTNNRAQKQYFKPVLSQQNKIRKPVEIIQLSDDSNQHQFLQEKKQSVPVLKVYKEQKPIKKPFQFQECKLKEQIILPQKLQKQQQNHAKDKERENMRQQKKAKRKIRQAYEQYGKLFKNHQKNKKNKRIKKYSEYMLTDNQKYFLQILKYRDYNHKQIMVGPLFQANLPKFIRNTKHYETMRNNKRQLLMMRRERQL